ncbi:MAG: hypothetical protein K2H20_04180, partial [Bacilli bacterium]|nr:hypothetical protein [Bacilli bacterium]
MKQKYLLVESIKEVAYNNNEIYIVSYNIKNNSFDKQEVSELMPTLWDLLLQAYNNDIKGVNNPKRLFKNTTKVRVCYYEGNVVTCAFYSDYKGGNKLMYGGAMRGELHEIGKQGFDAIVQRDSDVENIEEYNWVEASGSVEKAFKRHSAYNLPSKYASEVLQIKDISIVDNFHYKRVIGNENEEFVKTIFGIVSKNILQQIAMDTFGHLYKNAKYTYQMLKNIQNLTEAKQLNVFINNDRPAIMQYAINMFDHFDETSSYGKIYEMKKDLMFYFDNAYEILN